MRIVAGKYKSQPLTAPAGRQMRPTSDRLRETLFNVLAPRIEGAVFADLFAGTGAVGIEALSRGARQVWFAENARPSLAALRSNLLKLGILSGIRVEPAGTRALLGRVLQERIQLDIAFLDPPYSDQAAYKTTLGFLAEHPVLSTHGIVVVEHSSRLPAAAAVGDLASYRSLRQGEASLTFYRRGNPAAGR